MNCDNRSQCVLTLFCFVIPSQDFKPVVLESRTRGKSRHSNEGKASKKLSIAVSGSSSFGAFERKQS